MKKKLILDVDTGVDDAQAIMVALSSPNVEVLGITCCHGNTPLENVVKNTLRVLKVCKRLDIPVYKGFSQPLLDNKQHAQPLLDNKRHAQPLLDNKQHAEDYHGKDGLGDVPDPDAPGIELLQKEQAVHAMIKITKQHPEEVILVATGPLTNLAVAVQLDPSFPKRLKALYLMGGNTESRGNTSVCGEFNFVADPEAAYAVLERFNCPTYIATWEFSCRCSLPWSFCDELFSQKSEKAAFMKKISAFSMAKAKSDDYQKEVIAGGGFNPCDVFALAAAVDDSVITKKEEVAVTVELGGRHTRGMMVLDYMELLKKEHKVFIMKTVDVEKLKKMLINAIK